MTILPITLTIAGAAALLQVWLGTRVSLLRRRLDIGVGDGGNEAFLRRVRAHGNYAENMPLLLILVALIELGSGSHLWLWGAAILFVVARIAHAFGMDRPGTNPLRVFGIGASWLVLLGLGIYVIVLAYSSPTLRAPAEAPPARASAAAVEI